MLRSMAFQTDFHEANLNKITLGIRVTCLKHKNFTKGCSQCIHAKKLLRIENEYASIGAPLSISLKEYLNRK